MKILKHTLSIKANCVKTQSYMCTETKKTLKMSVLKSMIYEI